MTRGGEPVLRHFAEHPAHVVSHLQTCLDARRRERHDREWLEAFLFASLLSASAVREARARRGSRGRG